MKLTRSLIATVALVGFAALSPVHAQNKPAAKPAPGKSAKPKKDAALQEALLTEKMLGKPLTATQKADLLKAIRTRKASEKATRDTYLAQVSKAVGIPSETLKKRAKEIKDAQRAMAKMQPSNSKAGVKH